MNHQAYPKTVLREGRKSEERSARDTEQRRLLRREKDGDSNSRSSNVSSNDQVPEEEPSADERILRASGRHSHDRVVGSVESKSSSGKAIGNDVLQRRKSIWSVRELRKAAGEKKRREKGEGRGREGEAGR